ncbi:MAG: glycosyltransferase [Bdellovibrionales bacterium]|nr:glycosyltransferase [Bdellovibrionales bacterium]
MSSEPLISVVIPSYNHSQYIGQAIDSVFKQTYKNLELIVIDDGSSDNSVQVIKSALRRPPKKCKVQFISRPNKGAHHTINEGLELATGDYLTILNSDDYYHKSRLSILSKKLKKRQPGLVMSYVHHIDTEGKPLSVKHPMREWYQASLSKKLPSVGFRILDSNIAVTTGNLMFTRTLYDKIGGFKDFMLCHDYDFLLRSLFYAEPVLVKKPLINYRSHSANTVTVFAHMATSETPQVAFNYFKECIFNTQPENKMAPCKAYWKKDFEKFWEQSSWIKDWIGGSNPLDFL